MMIEALIGMAVLIRENKFDNLCVLLVSKIKVKQPLICDLHGITLRLQMKTIEEKPVDNLQVMNYYTFK